MKLANKIILSFFLTAIIFTIIIGPPVYIIGKKDMENAIVAHLTTTAQSRAHHVQTFLDSGRESVKQLSKSIVIERFLANVSKAEFDERYADVNIRLGNTVKIMDNVYDIIILNKDGIIVASSDGAYIGRDKSHDPYFIRGKEEVYIKDAYISQDKKIYSIAFSAPVLAEKNDVFLGVIVTLVSMNVLNKITTDRTGLGTTGEIYLVNSGGYMITPSRFLKDTFLKLYDNTKNTRQCLENYKRIGVKQEAREPIVFKDYRGTEVLGVGYSIPDVQWCLLAKIDESEAFAPLMKMKFLFLLVVLLIPIVAWLSGTIASRFMQHG